MRKLRKISELKTFPSEEMTEEYMLKYLITAEITESPDIYIVLSDIIRNTNLPVQVKVRAILATTRTQNWK